MPDRELLDYFIQHTDVRFEKVHEKLDILLKFRWMLIGASMAISGTISILFEVAKAIAGVK